MQTMIFLPSVTNDKGLMGNEILFLLHILANVLAVIYAVNIVTTDNDFLPRYT